MRSARAAVVRSGDLPDPVDTLTATASDFLTKHGTVARMGVTFYPALSDATITDPGSGNPSNFCTPASAIDVGLPTSDDDSALRDGASAVDFAIQRVGATASPLAGGVGGGTPTGDSIAFVAEHAGFGPTIQRQSFLLLMTDGLPNCNPASGLDANVNPAACDCTDGSTSTVCTYYPVLDCNDFNETARKVSDIPPSSSATATARSARRPTSSIPIRSKGDGAVHVAAADIDQMAISICHHGRQLPRRRHGLPEQRRRHVHAQPLQDQLRRHQSDLRGAGRPRRRRQHRHRHRQSVRLHAGRRRSGRAPGNGDGTFGAIVPISVGYGPTCINSHWQPNAIAAVRSQLRRRRRT